MQLDLGVPPRLHPEEKGAVEYQDQRNRLIRQFAEDKNPVILGQIAALDRRWRWAQGRRKKLVQAYPPDLVN